MTDRELLQQALDALESAANKLIALDEAQGDQDDAIYAESAIIRCRTAAQAIRDGLATPVKESLTTEQAKTVAWMYDFLNSDDREEVIRNWVTQNTADIEREKGFNVRPLYTAPQPRPWVSLTDDDYRECAQAMDAEPLSEGWRELQKFARAIEAKLKEKNGG